MPVLGYAPGREREGELRVRPLGGRGVRGRGKAGPAARSWIRVVGVETVPAPLDAALFAQPLVRDLADVADAAGGAGCVLGIELRLVAPREVLAEAELGREPREDPPVRQRVARR